MVIKDQLGRELFFKYPPKRIVSLVPSITEFLSDLNLENEVVGITKFCIRPESWLTSKQRVGGTKNIHMTTILSLQPDIIIANKEENEQSMIEQLQAIFPVYVSDVVTITDMFVLMENLGVICDRAMESRKIIQKSKESTCCNI